MNTRMIGLALAGLLLAIPAAAQDAGHEHYMAADGGSAPSTAAYIAANDKMHRDMDIAYGGDADVDFARAMIAHHQGAIDMARVELRYGDDPEIRKLAEAVIAAQTEEIAFMEAWLAANGAE